MASRLLVGVLLLLFVSADAARPAAQDRTPQLERVACDYPVPMPIPQDVNRECGCGGREYLFGQTGPAKLVAQRVQ